MNQLQIARDLVTYKETNLCEDIERVTTGIDKLTTGIRNTPDRLRSRVSTYLANRNTKKGVSLINKADTANTPQEQDILLDKASKHIDKATKGYTQSLEAKKRIEGRVEGRLNRETTRLKRKLAKRAIGALKYYEADARSKNKS